MLGGLKEKLKTKLYNKCYNEYAREKGWQSDRYAAYLKQLGEPSVLEMPAKTAVPCGTDACPDISSEKTGFSRIIKGKHCILFAARNGIVEKRAVVSFDALFEEHPSACAAYADEDCVNQDGKRHSPWLKPAFSPDTLAVSFYPGNIFAVRAGSLPAEDTEGPEVETEKARLLFLRCVKNALEQAGVRMQKGIRPPVERLTVILFHFYADEEDEGLKEPLPLPEENSYTEWLMQANLCGKGFSEEIFRMGVRTALERRRLASIIIPSKDNPEILENCLASIKGRPAGTGYEIIVVDNGSTEENRGKLEAMSESYGFRYLYEPMEFNFSKMCNIGAKEAGCEYLLFLNDDIEIAQDDWLALLYEKASLSYVGAVGAKLLYPDSDLIQHAGVTNLKAGPAHKLLKEHDSVSCYHGRNRGVHDMIAVTAACLMVGRGKYYEAGGYYEGIAVSYNDVDLCFSLYELGYYNIQRNDVVFYHHESLSRGDDNLSEAKWERLLTEKDSLYRRHPGLRGQDPFYSPGLAGHFSDYICNFAYEYERRDCYTHVKPLRGKEPVKWENNCLMVTVEHARLERKLDLEEEKDVLWIEGWSYVLGMDNCRYRRELLLLREDGGGYRAKLLTRYRKDVEAILPEQQNVALAGFTCRIPRESMKPGRYLIAMLAADRCSKQRLYQKTDSVLVVE